MDQQGQEQEQNVITILLTADNHLGYLIPGQPARKREELRQHLRRAFQQATDFAVGQGVDLFIQAGDLFDSTRPDEQDRTFVAERLAELKQAGIRTFALGGMHDTPGVGTRFIESSDPIDLAGVALSAPAPQLSFARLGALHYFPPLASDSGEALRPVFVDIRGALLGLCGFSAAQLGQLGQAGDPLAHVRIDSEIERATIPLLLLSTPVEGESTASPLSTLSTLLAQTPFRAVLAGSAHAYRRFTLGQTDIIIAGATQRFDFQEPVDEAGFVFLGIAADGVRWCRHIAVDSIHLRRLDIPLAQWWSEYTDTVGPGGSIEPTSRLLEELRPLCTEDAMVQLRLTGEISRQRYHQLELSSIRRYGEAHAFAFSIDDSALTFLPGDGSAADSSSRTTAFDERLSPREELIALADEWIAAAQDEQEQKALQATKEELLAALWSTT